MPSGLQEKYKNLSVFEKIWMYFSLLCGITYLLSKIFPIEYLTNLDAYFEVGVFSLCLWTIYIYKIKK